MKIAPIGLAMRNCSQKQQQKMVEYGILSSHVHPEGVDAAWVQASSIAWLLQRVPKRAAAGASKDSAGDVKTTNAGGGNKAGDTSFGSSRSESADAKAGSSASAPPSSKAEVTQHSLTRVALNCVFRLQTAWTI